MAKYGKENMRKTPDFAMNSAENEYFTIGSVIQIVDIHKDTYKGTVRSFDVQSKILSIGKFRGGHCHWSLTYPVIVGSSNSSENKGLSII